MKTRLRSETEGLCWRRRSSEVLARTEVRQSGSSRVEMGDNAELMYGSEFGAKV